MRIAYDPRGDILVIDLDTPEGITARRKSGKRLGFGAAYVDLAEDGTILSIEIEGASKRYDRAEMDALLEFPKEPISLAEAARISGIDAQALKKACQEGRLAGKKVGRNWTTTVGALTAYKTSRKHAGPASLAEAVAAAEVPPVPKETAGRASKVASEPTASAKASAPRERAL